MSHRGIEPKFGKDRKPIAIRYLFHKWNRKYPSAELTRKLKNALGEKLRIKVERRNGVEIYVTVDRRGEYEQNRLRLLNYSGA